MRARTMLMLAVVLCAARGLSAQEPQTNIAWQTDLLKARAIAEKTNRPLLVVFGADWCTFCKKMEGSTLQEPEMVRDINTYFVPVHLDFDAHKKIVDALEIKSIPCSVVLSIDADVLSRHDGFAKSPEYRKTLAKGLKAHQINLAGGQENSNRR